MSNNDECTIRKIVLNGPIEIITTQPISICQTEISKTKKKNNIFNNLKNKIKDDINTYIHDDKNINIESISELVNDVAVSLSSKNNEIDNWNLIKLIKYSCPSTLSDRDCESIITRLKEEYVIIPK